VHEKAAHAESRFPADAWHWTDDPSKALQQFHPLQNHRRAQLLMYSNRVTLSRSPLTTDTRCRDLLVFHLADRIAAFPLEQVERIAPMAELGRPPGMPSVLEGILNLAGSAVPVLRLDRLFQLPAQHVGLYSTLILMGDGQDGRIGMLVDRVSQILSVPESAFVPIAGESSFNTCAEATVAVGEDVIPVLSPALLLIEKERKALWEFQETAQRRLKDWEGSLT
jgi:purine-binding chemotaxis protein CheW